VAHSAYGDWGADGSRCGAGPACGAGRGGGCAPLRGTVMPPFEVLLPIGAIGLYLFDSVLLLYSNEVLFVHHLAGGRGRWGFVMSSALLLGGRRLCFVNPFTPAIPQFRVKWSEADTRQERESLDELHAFFAALRPVQYLVAVLWVLLAALPVEIAVLGTGPELLVLMASFYLVIVVMLVYVYVRRGALRLSSKAFAAVAFDALACSPFAVNLARKLAMRRSLAGNPIEFASQSFDAPAFAALIAAVSARVGEEQQREFGETTRRAELERYRQELVARVKDAPQQRTN
jgi:hypothetical protein